MISLPESPRWYLLKARRLERRNLSTDRSEIEKQYERAFYALRTLRHTKIQAARDLFYIDSWLHRPAACNIACPEAESSRHRTWEKPWRVWFQNILELRRQPRCRRVMTAGLIVMALQSLCGVNVLLYYSSTVFKDSLPNSSILRGIETIEDNTWIMATVNMKRVNVTTVDMRKDQIALAVGLAAEESL